MCRQAGWSLFALFMAVAPSTAQFSDAQLVEGWYRQYMQRVPTPQEVGPWVQEIRKTGNPDIVQAMILGSEEYFRRCDNNENRFLTQLQLDLTGREPNSGELKYWRHAYDEMKGQRQDVAFKFITQLKQSGQWPGPGPIPGPAPGPVNLPAQLTALCRNLSESVRVELAGTLQGRNLLIRTQALQQTADRYAQMVALNIPAFQLAQAMRNVEMAHNAVRQELNNPPGTAPNSSRISWQIGQTLEAIRRGTNWVPGAGGNLGYDPVAVAGNAAEAARNGGLLAQQIRLNPLQTPNLVTLLRYVESFTSNVESVRNQALQNGTLMSMQANFNQAAQQALVIRNQLTLMNTPGVSLQTWQQAEAAMTRLGTALSIGGVGPIMPPVNQQIFLAIAGAADRGINQVDIFMAQLTPWSFGVPGVPGVQGISRNLRGDLFRLRNNAANFASDRQLRSDMRDIVATLLRLDVEWNRVARTLPPGATIPSINGIGAAVEELRQLMR